MKIREFIKEVMDNAFTDAEIIKYCEALDRDLLVALVKELWEWALFEDAVGELSNAEELRNVYNLICERFNVDIWKDVEQPKQANSKQATDTQSLNEGTKNNVGVGGVLLSDVLNTDRVKSIFEGAYNKGWMEVDGGKYRWIGLKDKNGEVIRGKGQQFVYMIGEIFGYKKGCSGNDGNNIPCKAIEELFGVSDIYSKLIKCWEANKPQAWRKPIDEMIKKATEST